MKKIELLVGNNLKTDGKRVFKGEEIFFDPEIKFNLEKFSLVILYARGFNIQNLKEIVKTFSSPYISDVVIVVGKKIEKEEIKREIKIPYAKIAINPKPFDVLYSSIKIGLKAVSRNSDFIILQFGALSEIKRDTVHTLVNNTINSKKGIIIPIFCGKRGHPIIFSRKLLPLFFSLRKEKGLPYILRHYTDRIEEVEVKDKEVIKKS